MKMTEGGQFRELRLMLKKMVFIRYVFDCCLLLLLLLYLMTVC
jgi:hypothetical protein